MKRFSSNNWFSALFIKVSRTRCVILDHETSNTENLHECFMSFAAWVVVFRSHWNLHQRPSIDFLSMKWSRPLLDTTCRFIGKDSRMAEMEQLSWCCWTMIHDRDFTTAGMLPLKIYCHRLPIVKLNSRLQTRIQLKFSQFLTNWIMSIFARFISSENIKIHHTHKVSGT